MEKREDMSFGEDVRGDFALFLEAKHFLAGWRLDIDVGEGPIFFRVIDHGSEQHEHGFAARRKVVQWG